MLQRRNGETKEYMEKRSGEENRSNRLQIQLKEHEDSNSK